MKTLPAGQLAALARRHRIPYDELVQRWERGKRGRALVTSPFREKTDDWIATAEAAELLGVEDSALCEYGREYPQAATRVIWSHRATVAQGSGYLWFRPQVVEVVDLMRLCLLRPRAAFRVMHGLRVNGYTLERVESPRLPRPAIELRSVG